MNENENFCKAIEQAVVLPCAKEMQLISDEKCDFSSAYRRKIRRLTKNQDKTPHSLIKTTLQKMIFIIAAIINDKHSFFLSSVMFLPMILQMFLCVVNQHISRMDLLNRTELKKKLCLSLIILLIMNLSSTLKAVY